jgi:hypothetical protein
MRRMLTRRRLAPSNDKTAKPLQLVAINFIRDAEEYVKAARQLVAASGSIRNKWPSPTYFLLGQAMELTLKAYLAASGVQIKTLHNRIGHDLKRAPRRAQRHGFVPTARFAELEQWLAPYHLDHSFRYPKAQGTLSLPLASEAAEIIADAVEALEPYVRCEGAWCVPARCCE